MTLTQVRHAFPRPTWRSKLLHSAVGTWLLFPTAVAANVEPADLVVHHARVHTLNAGCPAAEAVAIRDGVFVAVGSDDDVRAHIGGVTRVIDARGRAVIPGIIESHVHAMGVAREEVSQPFVQLGSIAEIQDWIRQRAKTGAADDWIRVPRVEVTRIRERRLPTPRELDEASSDRPVFFRWGYAKREILVLNTAAMKAAGITAETVAPERGRIELGADGKPTGVLENAGELVAKFRLRSQLTETEHLDSLERLLRRYNAVGITGIGERNSSVDGLRTYEKLRAEGRLPLRVTVTLALGTDGSVAGTEKAIQSIGCRPGEGNEWVKAGPLKIFADGGVLYGTAFLRAPYGAAAFPLYGISDASYRGDLRFTAEQLANIFRTGHRLGWQLSAHVTGDAGADAVLDAIAAADGERPIRDRRPTLIHAYFPDHETASRAAKLGVCVDTQPAWYYKDGDTLATALGGSRIERFIGLQEWRKAGVLVALNSDHMDGADPLASLNPYHPFLTIQTAVTRKTDSGRVIGPDQRVSRQEALRMMTLDAAFLSFDEQRLGSIEVGKLGDLAILSQDPMTCDEDAIHETVAVTTVVGGRVVYEAAALK